jgi:hypothetical protein
VDGASGNGSEILILGEHNAERGDKLEIVRVESARYFHVAVDQSTYAFTLSGPDIISH